MTEDDLKTILSRKGYAISCSEPTIKSKLGPRTIESQIKREREIDNLESAVDDESLHAKKLQVNYSGKPEIRITFYRRRLADHSRAVSEKALVDCLQYAGLIEGDSEKEIRLTHVRQEKVETDEEERTEIEIFYDGVDFDNFWVPAKSNKAR